MDGEGGDCEGWVEGGEDIDVVDHRQQNGWLEGGV